MISVIIPLMPIMPYNVQIERTLRDLDRQTAETEVLVCKQPVEPKICKTRLLNEGFAQSKGDIIFHCDADIIFKDETVLQRMEEKLYNDDLDVIYPMFFSPFRKCLKIADGHPFMRREVREEHGPLDETLLGISLQEFVILHWLYFNKRFHCSREFVIDVNTEPFVKKVGKVHRPTRMKCRKIYDEVIVKLKEDGVWPIDA
jgi:glycosyltransferase involved in cell wall biosynthesis